MPRVLAQRSINLLEKYGRKSILPMNNMDFHEMRIGNQPFQCIPDFKPAILTKQTILRKVRKEKHMQAGKASIRFEHPPLIVSEGSVVGRKEGEGPIGHLFDRVEQDDKWGKNNWEEAESQMQKEAVKLALSKGGLENTDIRYLLGGDLLGQLIATSFGVMELRIPFFGVYGACSTMGEAMGLGAMLVGAGYADRVVSVASSHFATAEKQFRFPLGYGNQRPYSATWTVTGCGAVVLESADKMEKKNKTDLGHAMITGVTTGKIVDLGIKDSMNMGAAMAPAAFSTIIQNFEDFGVEETWYDKIITGDLGTVGRTILLDFMKEKGHNLTEIHMDCGIEIFDPKSQDTHAGGSGCGCSAVTFCS